MSNNKLKSCPYCGREDCSDSAVGGAKQERWWGNIFCRGCNMNGPDIGPEDTFSAWFEKAAEVWNSLPRYLQWTTEKPTEPGWYWRKQGYCEPIIVKVTDRNFGRSEKCLAVDGETREYFLTCNAQWAGPISKPMEDK